MRFSSTIAGSRVTIFIVVAAIVVVAASLVVGTSVVVAVSAAVGASAVAAISVVMRASVIVAVSVVIGASVVVVVRGGGIVTGKRENEICHKSSGMGTGFTWVRQTSVCTTAHDTCSCVHECDWVMMKLLRKRLNHCGTEILKGLADNYYIMFIILCAKENENAWL
jgi:hypothetical protein